MLSKRFTPQRYQLKKEAAQVALTGHPWIFRTHLSSAVEVFRTGQWLRLVDAKNEVLGYGIYDPEGLIGLRLLKRGSNEPDRAWISGMIDRALKKREPLRGYANAFRALHGENDGLPGIVIDVYNDTAVLQTYSASVDTLGRYAAAVLRQKLGLKNVIWKFPAKRRGEKKDTRALFGTIPSRITVREGKLDLGVEVGEGQKSGAFLDLRGLRKWIASQNLNGLRVLNLFCYTGTLGLAAEAAGAKEIWNVDISQGALNFAQNVHAKKKEKHRWICADIFDWYEKLDEREKFDLIIVDPPLMTSSTAQVPGALKAYRRLYRESLKHLTPRGQLLACCCTSRIARKRFEQEVKQVLGERLRYKKTIAPEDDHPVGVPEGDYLKLLVFGN